MSLYQKQQRLERLKRELAETEALIQVEKDITEERELVIQARVELRRQTETLDQKTDWEEFQRKQAIYCDCPEMSPDWRESPSVSHPVAHKGGSAS